MSNRLIRSEVVDNHGKPVGGYVEMKYRVRDASGKVVNVDLNLGMSDILRSCVFLDAEGKPIDLHVADLL
jgi:hypothetical protein